MRENFIKITVNLKGWIVQQTQEFTNLETALRTRRQIAECMKDITR